MKKLGIFYSFVGLIVISAIIFIGELFIYKQLVAAVTVKLVTVFEVINASCLQLPSPSVFIFCFIAIRKTKKSEYSEEYQEQLSRSLHYHLQTLESKEIDLATRWSLIYQVAQKNNIELKKRAR